MDVKLQLCSRPQTGPGYFIHASQLAAWSKSMCVKQKIQLSAYNSRQWKYKMTNAREKLVQFGLKRTLLQLTFTPQPC